MTSRGTPCRSRRLHLQPHHRNQKFYNLNTLHCFLSQAAKAPLMATHPDSMASFTYSPLLRPDSLRLLKVQPDLDKATGNICIKLREARKEIPYRCLSYVWGDQTERFAILANGCKMLIGKSLYEFLDLARHKFAKKPLWADAVCINQEDNEEKSVQVQRMGKTYANALEVLIWLGHNSKIVEYFHWVNKPQSIMSRAINRMQRARRIDTTPKACRKLIIEFALHPYWKRAWITQEVILARSKRILCGEAETRPSSLFPIAYESTRAIDGDDYSSAVLELNIILHLLKSDHDLSHTNELWLMIMARQDAKCQDARDKLYSLLGVIDHDTTFKVDYSENIVDLYWRAVQHFSVLCPETLNIFWDLLSMDRSLIMARVQSTGQNLSMLIPVSQTKVRRKLWQIKVATTGRRSHACVNSNHFSSSPVNRVSSSEIFLCPNDNKDRSWAIFHFSVRPSKTVSLNDFELDVHTTYWGRRICPTDTELWYVKGDRHRKLVTWEDVMRYSGRTAPRDVNAGNRPHLVVKLSQQFVFDCLPHTN
jgi:hypothetical protein